MTPACTASIQLDEAASLEKYVEVAEKLLQSRVSGVFFGICQHLDLEALGAKTDPM